MKHILFAVSLIAATACKKDGAATPSPPTVPAAVPAGVIKPVVVPAAIQTPAPGAAVTFGGTTPDPAKAAENAAAAITAAADRGKKQYCPDLTVTGLPDKITQGETLDVTLSNLLATGAWIAVAPVSASIGTHLVRSTAVIPHTDDDTGNDAASGSGMAGSSGSDAAASGSGAGSGSASAAVVSQHILLPLGVIEPGAYEVRVFCSAGPDLAYVSPLTIQAAATPIVVPGSPAATSPFLSATDPDSCPDATLGINKSSATNGESLTVSIGNLPPNYSTYVQIGLAGTASYLTYAMVFSGALPTGDVDKLVNLPLDPLDKSGDYVVSLACAGNTKPKLPLPVTVTASDTCKDSTIDLSKTAWTSDEQLSVAVNNMPDRGGRLELRNIAGNNVGTKTIAAAGTPSGAKLPAQNLTFDLATAYYDNTNYELRLYCGTATKPSVTRGVKITYADPCAGATITPTGSSPYPTDQVLNLSLTNIPTQDVTLYLYSSAGANVGYTASFTGNSSGGQYTTAAAALPLYGVPESGTYQLKLYCNSSHLSKTQAILVDAVDSCATSTATPDKASYNSTETMHVAMTNIPNFMPQVRIVLQPKNQPKAGEIATVFYPDGTPGFGPQTKDVPLPVPFDKTIDYDVKVSCLKDAFHGGSTVTIVGDNTLVKTACPDGAIALNSSAVSAANGSLVVTYTGTTAPAGGAVFLQDPFGLRTSYLTSKTLAQGTTVGGGGRTFTFVPAQLGLLPGSYLAALRCAGGTFAQVIPFTVTP